MTDNFYSSTNSNFNKLASLPISLVILLVLSLQAFTDLKKACPEAHSFCSRLSSDSYFYPFLNYSLYSQRYYEGDKVEQYVLLGIFKDSAKVPILPKDLGVSMSQYRKNVVDAVLSNDSQQIEQFVERYQNTHNRTLIGLQIEHRPLVLSRDGVSSGKPTVLRSIRFKAK